MDTCDSGTHQLDLSHYHCNSMYVPWRSNGKRRTQSWQNVTGAFTIFYRVRSHENALNSPFSLPVHRNAACKVTFIGGDPLRPERGLFPMPVMQDPVSSQEAAAAASSLLWTAIMNIFAWSIPSAPPKVRSVLPINDHQRMWEAHDSCDFLGACGAGTLSHLSHPLAHRSPQNRTGNDPRTRRS